MNTVWLDCDGTELKAGDVVILSPMPIEGTIQAPQYVIDHLCTENRAYVSSNDVLECGLGWIKTHELIFVSRPSEQNYENA